MLLTALRGARRGSGPGSRRNTFTRRLTRISRPPRPRRAARAPRPSTDEARPPRGPALTHSTKEANAGRRTPAPNLCLWVCWTITTKDDVHQRRPAGLAGGGAAGPATRRRKKDAWDALDDADNEEEEGPLDAHGLLLAARARATRPPRATPLASERLAEYDASHASIKDLRESVAEGHGAGCARLLMTNCTCH